MLKTKTERPEWACPYEPTWTGQAWIVRFPQEADAKRALLALSIPAPMAPMEPLYCAPDPNSNEWYVGHRGDL